MSDIVGNVLEIQRFSIHDGPGIRTTVFLKGCPLRCRWCHNSESQSQKPILSFMADKCIGCGYCLEACPNHAHKLVDGKHFFDRSLCRNCGLCAKECYAKALELVGQQRTANAIFDVVMCDKLFYETSGGGLTISGGEPTMQPELTLELLKLAKTKTIHIAIETCGFCKWDLFESILPFTDLFLYDWKETDSQKHLESCGVDNVIIRENLEKLSAAGAEIILRCPIIPGLNDRTVHFAGIARLYNELNLAGVELMPYHRLGESKYERFGMSDIVFTAPMPEGNTVKSWLKTLRKLGVEKILNEEPVA